MKKEGDKITSCNLNDYKFETVQLHAGQESPDPVTDARAVPIYQTSSYVFHNSEHTTDRAILLRDTGATLSPFHAFIFLQGLETLSLRVERHADVKSLVIHPASTTHSQMTPEELANSGIKPNTIRLSIGTEHIDDILADLSAAFGD